MVFVGGGGFVDGEASGQSICGNVCELDRARNRALAVCSKWGGLSGHGFLINTKLSQNLIHALSLKFLLAYPQMQGLFAN